MSSISNSSTPAAVAPAHIGWSGIFTVLITDASIKFGSFVVFSLARRFCLKSTRGFFVTRKEAKAKVDTGTFWERATKFVSMTEAEVAEACGSPDQVPTTFQQRLWCIH